MLHVTRYTYRQLTIRLLYLFILIILNNKTDLDKGITIVSKQKPKEQTQENLRKYCEN